MSSVWSKGSTIKKNSFLSLIFIVFNYILIVININEAFCILKLSSIGSYLIFKDEVAMRCILLNELNLILVSLMFVVPKGTLYRFS